MRREDFYGEIVERAPFAYVLQEMVLDEEGRCFDLILRDVNAAFEMLTGLKREQMLNCRVSEIWPGAEKEIIQYAGLDERNDRVEECDFAHYFEFLGCFCQGRLFSPLPGYLVIVFQDVTEEMERRKELQKGRKEIERLSEHLKLIFESTQDAVFLAEFKEGNFYYITSNPAHQRLTGFKLEDIRGKTPEEVLSPELATKVKKGYMRCIEEGRSVSYEETLPMPAGEKVWQVMLTPVKEGGDIRYIIGSRRDITLQKKQEQNILKKLAYEKMASAVLKLALQERRKDVFLPEVLKIIGEGTGVSRTYIFEQDPGQNTVSNTYEWVAPGIEPQKDRLQELKLEFFEWWMDRIYKGEAINFSRVEEVPDEFTRLFLQEQGIISVLVLPISNMEGKVSFIGFDECKEERVWEEDDIILLTLVADVIAQYFRMCAYEEEIVYKSYHDALTGLYNRRFVDEKLADFDIPDNLPLAIIALDVNASR